MPLTESQQQAINKTKGPCVILAGAGTGKTFTIVEKVKNLSKIIEPSKILVLTFSNEATNSIREKVTSGDVCVKTFHGFCADLIREFGNWVGVDYDFEILLEDDAKVFLRKYLGISGYYADWYIKTIGNVKDFGITIENINEHISVLKDKLIKETKRADIEVYAEEADTQLKTLHLLSENSRDVKKKLTAFLEQYKRYQKYVNFVNAWAQYEKLKVKKQFLDFGDLTIKALEILSRINLGKKYKYVIVDEFQDTNKLQFELLKRMGIRDITIVGDLNQSIYGFRGSFKKIFDAFNKEFAVKKEGIIKLDDSFRSPDKILRTAHKLITNNYENPEDSILVKNYEHKEGENITLVELKNDAEEARKVAEIVKAHIEKGVSLKEICVLFRTHRQGKAIIDALLSKDIPISTAGEIDLLSRPEIKTTINYLAIINNLRERTGTGEQAYWNLFHYANNLSAEDSLKISRYLKQKRGEELSIDYVLVNKLQNLDLSPEGVRIIKNVLANLNILKESTTKDLPEIVLDIYELLGLNRRFSYERTNANLESMMNLREFYDLASQYETYHKDGLKGFIDYLEILEETNITIPASKIMNEDSVKVMTIHAVKGLEFEVVIITNLADKRFPIERTPKEPLIPKELMPEIADFLETKSLTEEEYEDEIKKFEKQSLILEERRLFYVAITRAKKKLYLTFAEGYGKETGPSRFLSEIGYAEIKNTKNKDINYELDLAEKCTIFTKDSKYEDYKSLVKKQILDSLDHEDFNSLVNRLSLYFTLRDELVPVLKHDIDEKELKKQLEKVKTGKSMVKFDKDNFTFSPTALLEYDSCPKKFELGKILQMPERGAFKLGAASAGSLIHEVLEEGVKNGFDSLEQFEDLANTKSKLNQYKGIDFADVKKLLKIFWLRNKGTYDKNTLTEYKLSVDIDGLKFYGIADRVDRKKDSDIIIDYKTQKEPLDTKERSWQLGYYAIAAKKLDLNPKKVILEMLRQEKPVIMDIDGDNVSAGRLKGFSLKEVEKELIETAKKIINDYETEFKPVEDDGPCRNCRYKFYCPKWG
jgi:DNA helicase-2/ATP-dependent DNA helicase PcrA